MQTYTLLDSGHGNKLEQIGPYRLIRPAPQAIWSPRRKPALWEGVHAIYQRSKSGGGHWDYKQPLPESWTITYHRLKLTIKLTDFGHVGLFAEQGPNWDWIQTQINQAKRPIHVLNTFAYTGGSTLAAAMAGAKGLDEVKVVHLDSSKGIVTWARENATLGGLAQHPIRWVVDDVSKFVKREIKRNQRYDALIFDPPSFGRGSKGEVWKFERDLPQLLEQCQPLLSDQPLFVLLSAHTPGFTPLALENLLADMMQPYGGHSSSAEMVIPEQASDRFLPSGTMGRWWRA